MELRAFVELLASVRDHLSVAIRDAERGDAVSARLEVEAAGDELIEASEELRP